MEQKKVVQITFSLRSKVTREWESSLIDPFQTLHIPEQSGGIEIDNIKSFFSSFTSLRARFGSVKKQKEISQTLLTLTLNPQTSCEGSLEGSLRESLGTSQLR
jgi:hypothetical protein